MNDVPFGVTFEIAQKCDLSTQNVLGKQCIQGIPESIVCSGILRSMKKMKD